MSVLEAALFEASLGTGLSVEQADKVMVAAHTAAREMRRFISLPNSSEYVDSSLYPTGVSINGMREGTSFRATRAEPSRIAVSMAATATLKYMITGALKNNVDRIWDTFWSGGISNPVSVIEQFTYLLFIKDLDERQVQIDKRRALGDPTATEDIFDASQQDLRWRNLIEDRDIARRKATIINKVFPFIKAMGGKGFQEHMANASFDIESEATLSRVMELIDQLHFSNKDMKGDLYEYMLDKLSTSGTNGQFRTPSHIIELIVALMEPTPKQRIIETFMPQRIQTRANYDLAA